MVHQVMLVKVQDPLKQGLKPRLQKPINSGKAGKSTRSTKTRIETS